MPYLGGGFLSGNSGGGGGNATAQLFSGTLDSGGELNVTGLTNALTSKAFVTLLGNSDEKGTLRVDSRTATSILVKSDAGLFHSGVSFEGALIST